MLPNQLINFALYANGTDYKGVIPEVNLPDIERKIEAHRAGGMAGPVDMDFGSEGLEATVKVAGWLASLLAPLGARSHDAAQLRFMGALSNNESEGVSSCEAVMRGRIKKFSPGSSKPGEPTEQEITYGLSYYKLVIDGVTVIETDLVNNVYMVLGVDRESDVRAAMGY